jgi:hypothetical protein
MADLGIRPDVIELCVNHTSGLRSGVAGIYNKSQLMPERKAALERWAAHIGRLISGEPAKKVVKLRTGKSDGAATYAAQRRRASRGDQ